MLLRHPAVSRAAVYAVPDPSSGDQVAAALVLHDDAGLDPRSLEVFLAEQPDLSAQAWPRFVRICDDLPTTATNKVLRRELTAQGVEHVDGPVWLRTERGTAYRRA